jgi:DNA-binding response OmpR family regulator
MPLQSHLLFCSSQPEEHTALRRILAQSPWKVETVSTARQCLRRLRGYPSISAVICGRDLPDGDWRSILRQLDALPERPIFMVSARLADDHLWSEALNLGAFDVLRSTPFETEAVMRATENAWLAWNRTYSRWAAHAAAG